MPGPYPPGQSRPGSLWGGSSKLRHERVLGDKVGDRHLDVNARVGGVSLCRDPSNFHGQILEVFRTGVLAGSGASFARNIFFHQSAAVIVRSCVQAQLRKMAIQLYPRNLDVVDGAGEHDTGESVDFEMFREGRARAR